jgi:fatty-acyl-CoA synthase
VPRHGFQGRNLPPADTAELGSAHEQWGQKVVAFVVLRPDKTASSEELSAFCQHRLASFKKPAVIHLVEELPRNPLGKILRQELREQEA